MNKFLIPLLLFTSLLSAEALDPYRWLEEETPEQTQWVENQRAHSNRYFAELSTREVIESRLKDIVSYESVSLPKRQGNTLYYFKKRLGDNKSVLIQCADDHERVLVDPNTSEDEVNLVGFSVSPNGRHLAFGLSLAGSDQNIWQFLDLKTRRIFTEVLDEIQFSKVSWNEESTAVYYVRNCKQLYRHVLGAEPSEDQLLYEGSKDHLVLQAKSVLEGRYLLVAERPWVVKNNRILLIDLKDPNFYVHELVPSGDVEVSFAGETNDQLLFITDEDCCFGKLVTIDLDCKQTLIEEQDSVLDDAVVVGQHIVCAYYKCACAALKVYDFEGNFIEELPLPGKGTVYMTHSKKSPYLDYCYADFKTPSHSYAYNLETKEHTSTFAPKLNFDPSKYTTEQVWYTSKDDTRVPMFLTHRKDLTINEKTHVLLYGYGGFGISLTPRFHSHFLAWVESGGVVAIPSLRGGKELGNRWYNEGCLHKKQNVFDDCIAAAEYLITEKIGSPNSLAVFGTSNGGLLSGACLTQRPDLFRAAIVNKGVLDMLRFHLYTIGKYWVCDYGNPEDPEDYAYLLSYSPYHNVKKGTRYPSILVNTADHDDRVVPMHSYKFAAALQEAQEGEQPILLRLEEACGHGGADSQKQEISFGTDMLSFLFHEFGLD